MTTIILMLSLVLVFAVIAILGVRYKPDKDSFFDLKDTVVLKGLFCVIVVLVHVPSQYQNPIQDGIGSFAYIGVTFFFMTSAFGLMYNVAQKEGYLREFWRRRLPPLLIPALLCNALSIAVSTMEKNQITLWSAINIGAWVKVLLLYYFSFWIIKIIPGGGIKRDVLICVVVMLISLIGRLVNRELPLWFTESYGFVYGIVLFDVYEGFKTWANRRWILKTLVIMLLGVAFGIAYIKVKPINIFGAIIV